jgi:hypothetical protein
MRREKLTLSRASKLEETTPANVRKYMATALKQARPRGRLVVTPRDRIAKQMFFLTEKGRIPVTVRDSRTSSTIGRHLNAVKRWARNRDESPFQEFKNIKVRIGSEIREFVTDPVTLRRLADAGEIPEGPYRAIPGGTE